VDQARSHLRILTAWDELDQRVIDTACSQAVRIIIIIIIIFYL